MHQYLDADGSGTSPTCVSSTIGVERIQAATDWLKAHNFKGFLGELGAGSNGEPSLSNCSATCLITDAWNLDVCIAAIKGALTLMQQPGTPWIGALWWAGMLFYLFLPVHNANLVPLSRPLVGNILSEHVSVFFRFKFLTFADILYL